MKKIIYAFIAVLTLSALAFAATGNAHAYTYHDGTIVKIDRISMTSTAQTGVLVDYDMLVTEQQWMNNPVDYYVKNHFYPGQKVRITTTVDGVTHYVITTVRGAYKPGKYGSGVTFEILPKSAATLHTQVKRKCRYKAVTG